MLKQFFGLKMHISKECRIHIRTHKNKTNKKPEVKIYTKKYKIQGVSVGLIFCKQ